MGVKHGVLVWVDNRCAELPCFGGLGAVHNPVGYEEGSLDETPPITRTPSFSDLDSSSARRRSSHPVKTTLSDAERVAAEPRFGELAEVGAQPRAGPPLLGRACVARRSR